MYDIVLIRHTREAVETWLESRGITAFLVCGIRRWPSVCCGVDSAELAANASSELGAWSIHMAQPDDEQWEFSIFNEGPCMCAFSADWSKRPVLVDRTRLDFGVIMRFVLGERYDSSTAWQEQLETLRDARLADLKLWLFANNWDRVRCETLPDVLFRELVSAPMDDDLVYGELMQLYRDNPAAFRIIYPETVFVGGTAP